MRDSRQAILCRMKLPTLLLFTISICQGASSAPKEITINAQNIYIVTSNKGNQSLAQISEDINSHIFTESDSVSHSDFGGNDQWSETSSSAESQNHAPDFIEQAFEQGVPVNESLHEKLNELDEPQKLISAPGCPL